MKFIKTAAFGAALCAIALPALAADTLAKIAEAGHISVSYRESSIPFSYLAGPDKPVGFSVDVTNAIVQEIKRRVNMPQLEVQTTSVTSANRIPLLLNGTIDIECGSTTNNTVRAKDVAFAINYFYTGTRLLTKKGSHVRNYADLAGKPLALTSGTTNVQVLRKYSHDKNLDIKFLLAKDHADALLLVESDRAAAFAIDDVLLYGLAASAKNPGLWEVVGDSLQIEPYACMVRKDDPKFKQLVDSVIAGLMKSGEFDRLYTKWFMSPIPPNNINLKLPMSKELRENLKELSDKPAT